MTIKKPFHDASHDGDALTTAWAQDTGTRTVSYIDTDGQEQSVDATVIDNNNMPTTLNGGWYVVTEDVEYSNGIHITDGWIYTDGTDFFDTGSISSVSGAASYRPKWWDGNGTSDDPYLIKTTADLNQLAMRVNSNFSDYSGTYFKLDNDITYTHKADNEEFLFLAHHTFLI